MTQFGYTPRTTGPLGRRLGWAKLRVALDNVPIPEPQLPGPSDKCLAVRQAMARALRAHPDTERIRRIARQATLVCIAQDYGRDVAAKEMSTLPEAVDAARAEVAPVVARDALEIACEPESFRRIFAALVEGAEKWGLRDLADITATVFGVRVADLISYRRHQEIVRPRQTAMWLCRRFTPHSLPVIGRSLGDRDHTTVLWGCRKIEAVVKRHNLDGGDIPDLWAKLIKHAVEPA